MWEVYFCDTGKTVYWSTRECHKFFGKDEFTEIKQGYAPHVVAVWVAPHLLDGLPGFNRPNIDLG